MRSSHPWRLLLPIFLALLAISDARAYVMKLTPVKEILTDMESIFLATVQKVDPERPSMVLTVTEQFKGKVLFERMPVNLTGDTLAAKDKHLPIMLERIAPDLPVMVFAQKRGKKYVAFCYTNGTWFQMIGTIDDDASIRWAFLHGEPYFRRTFKGTTTELKQIVIDGLASKKEPPEPDAKAEPGFGPPIKKEEKKCGTSTMFGVIPTFVVIGPLAFLAALFPAVFGGLALMMRRWLVLLSIASFCSTIYFAHGWFSDSLGGSWWGKPQAMWFICSALCLIGSVWSARRFWTARQAGQDDVMRTRKFDRISLIVMSTGFFIALVVANRIGESLTVFPWGEILVMATGVWLCAGFVLVRKADPGGISPEMVFLSGLTLASGMMGALEAGKAGNTSAGVTNIATTTGSDSGIKFSSILWTFQAPGKGVMFASPVADGERAYTAVAHSSGLLDYGCVYAVNMKTGEEVWKFDNDEELKPVFSSPTLADGFIYIGEGFHKDQECKLFCLDAKTGKKVWEFATQSHTESQAAVVDGKVVFGAGNDGIYCIDAKSGKKLWQYTGEGGVHVDANPVIANGKVYGGSGLSRTHQATRVFCLDLKTGQPIWSNRVEYSAFAPPTVDGNHVYFGIGNGNFSEDKEPIAGVMMCLNADTGVEVWRSIVPNSILSKPAVDRANVYFGCRDGKLYAVDRETGKKSWDFNVGSPVLSSPVFGNSAFTKSPLVIYTAGQKGMFYAIDLETGKAIWSLDLISQSMFPEVELVSSPTVVVDRDGPKTQRRILFGVGFRAGLSAPAKLYCVLEETNP